PGGLGAGGAAPPSSGGPARPGTRPRAASRQSASSALPGLVQLHHKRSAKRQSASAPGGWNSDPLAADRLGSARLARLSTGARGFGSRSDLAGSLVPPALATVSGALAGRGPVGRRDLGRSFASAARAEGAAPATAGGSTFAARGAGVGAGAGVGEELI